MRLLLLVLLAATSIPSGTPQPAAAAAPIGDRLILTPANAETVFHVEADRAGTPSCPTKPLPPLRVAYSGKLEVIRQSDGGLRLVNSVDFPTYLAGLAEVPLSWPVEALRAQVIAARSYALDAIRRGARTAARRGYDICSSDQCQVFRGATVARGAFGERWLDAVADTRGKVLVHDGRVIQAFFFSTSTGRTARSFPGGTTRPYLPSVDGEDDDAPLARWTADMTFDDLGAVLKNAGYGRATPVRSVKQQGANLTITGATGSLTLSKKEVRATLNKRAPCLFPDRYPGKGSATGGKLPQVVPHVNFTARTVGETLRMTGRGWGHDVGMSQWGARSLATRGWSAERIVRHYYGPARVTTITEPDVIRVLAAEDMKRVVVAVEGDATITSATGSVLAPGTTFQAVGGKAMTVQRATTGTFKPVLEVRTTAPPLRAKVGDPVAVPFTLSRSARVTVSVTDADGAPVATVPEESYESGDYVVALPIGNDPGEYRAVVEGYDGLDRVRSAPYEISVTPVAAAADEREPEARGNGAWLVVAGAIAVVLVASAWVVWWRRRRAPSMRA